MEDRFGRVRGRDLLQFFVAGGIIWRGESERLYDHEYFTDKHYELLPVDETRERLPSFSLYPPTVGLLFAVPAGLPYEAFVVLGWLWTVAGYVAAVRWIVQDLDPPRDWRLAAWLGILGFHSAIVMLWTCQFGWLWLLVFLAGFRLRRRHHDFAAGLCLSLLTLKPQFAVGAVLWLVMVPAWRTLLGLGVGFLAQAAIVAAILGPHLWRDYFVAASIYSNMTAIYSFDAEYQQATLGTLQVLLGNERVWLFRGAYLAVVGLACAAAFRILHARTSDHRVEESTATLLVLVYLPHVLIYDLTLLLIPIAHLMSLHRDRPEPFPLWPGASLYGLTMIAPLYRFVPGFSLVPAAMLVTLCCFVYRWHRPPQFLPVDGPTTPGA